MDLDVLGHCAERYDVSLTAAILKWLSYTDEKAIVVMSRDMVFARTAGTTPSGDETLSTAVIRAIPGRILKAILQRAERRQSRQNLRRRSDIPVTS